MRSSSRRCWPPVSTLRFLGAPASSCLLVPAGGQHVDSSPGDVTGGTAPGVRPVRRDTAGHRDPPAQLACSGLKRSSSFTAPVRAAGDRDESGGGRPEAGSSQEPVHARDVRPAAAPAESSRPVAGPGKARPGSSSPRAYYTRAAVHGAFFSCVPRYGFPRRAARQLATAPRPSLYAASSRRGGGALPCGAGAAATCYTATGYTAA
jgi:hypothetical protein